ncbi:hypothetical protein [Mesorhizobium sp. M1348]|uniref:hypothetical protein n=1 Tax=unclassified Mesorhizobium TaxID=325217 RepID=UPI00333BB000
MVTVEKVSEVLPEWGLDQPLRIAEAERLRKAWTDGLESGPFARFDIGEIIQKARGRFGNATNNQRNG